MNEMDQALSNTLFGDKADSGGPSSVGSGDPDGILASFASLDQGAREEASFSKELQGITLFKRVRTSHDRCLKKGCVVNGLNANI